MATIRVEELRKEFVTAESTVVAIENITFEVSGNEFVSVVGPSGCGKSTLLNVLSGIETASSGKVEIVEGSRDARIGYVFQSARLLPWRTVIDNLMFVQPGGDGDARGRCERYLDMVELGHTAKQYPSQLSGGM